MRSRVALWTVLGVGLIVATVLQARAVCSVGATSMPAAAAADRAPAPRQVAAEGRVVTYPGAEVRVAAERGGRLLRVVVDEGSVVRKGDLVAEIDAAELRASLAEARARVSEAEAEIRLAQANQVRRRNLVAQQVAAVADLDQSNRDLEIAQAHRDTARAEVDRLSAQLQKMRIVAPISGTVTARSVHAGETVDVGSAVVTIADLGRLRVEGEADEADAAALVEGAAVEVKCDGYPGQSWHGRIEEVGHSVTLRKLKPQDPSRPTDTRVIAVKVAFAEPSPLKLGTTVELGIGH
jgi:RND family efflux transporter MFP subunit